MMHRYPPRDRSCPSSQSFYSCASIQFTGCCAVDPCAQSGCLIAGTIQSLSSARIRQETSTNEGSSKSASQPASTNPSESTTTSSFQISFVTTLNDNTFAPAIVLITSTVGKTQIIEASTSTSQLASISTSPHSSTASSGPLTTSKSGIVASPTASPSSASKRDHKKIIIGVVSGGGGLVLLLILIWLCFRWKGNRSKRNSEKNDDDPRFEGIDANRGGDILDQCGM